MSLNQLCALILTAETVVTAQANLSILDAAFDSMPVTLLAFLGLLQALHFTEVVLFGIPGRLRCLTAMMGGEYARDDSGVVRCGEEGEMEFCAILKSS
jgi:hypothetical protein